MRIVIALEVNMTFCANRAIMPRDFPRQLHTSNLIRNCITGCADKLADNKTRYDVCGISGNTPVPHAYLCICGIEQEQ